MNLKKAIKNFSLRTIKEPVYVPVVQNQLLEGRRILITGGSGGIGSAIATACVNSGATVIIAGRNIDRLSLVKNKIITEYHCDAEMILSLALDISKLETLIEKVEETKKLLGGGVI